jgi:hypothetical protein
MIFTHQCNECGCTVLLAPGTCEMCIVNMKEAGTWKESTIVSPGVPGGALHKVLRAERARSVLHLWTNRLRNILR